MHTLNSTKELLEAYQEGQRYFKNWEFPDEGSVQGMDLRGAIFEGCFLCLDFKKTNLENAQLIGCNIKTADFSNANLANAVIRDCCVEGTIYKGAIVTNLTFEHNSYFGITLSQEDFNQLC